MTKSMSRMLMLRLTTSARSAIIIHGLVVDEAPPFHVVVWMAFVQFGRFWCRRLIREESNPAEVQDGKGNHQTEAGHGCKLHVHDIFVLLVQFQHFFACHVTSFNERKVFRLFLSKDTELHGSSNGRRRLGDKGIGGRCHEEGGNSNKQSQSNREARKGHHGELIGFMMGIDESQNSYWLFCLLVGARLPLPTRGS